MKVTKGRLDGVLLIEPKVFSDDRGWFKESYQRSRYAEAGLPELVQENVSCSRRGVVRGLHFQRDPHAQGKLVHVLRGACWDVVVDIRPGSPTYGQWEAFELSAANHLQVWIPSGFAHGFQALEDETVFHYACSAPYRGDAEGAWNVFSESLALPWPLKDAAIVSDKDRLAPAFVRSTT
jgi:dTDP-4-dehydrorhamnose 3,5-epimerase